MQKTIRLLTLLLAAQVLLAVGLNLSGPNLSAKPADAPLLGLENATVDRIVIEGVNNKQRTLVKKGDAWVLADMGDFPVAEGKVKTFLERLRNLRHGLPVGTSEAALKRFKVTQEEFERRILLQAGDNTLATLYLGTTPGARQVHARSADDDAVYVVDFAIYDAPLNADAWIDRNVLQFPLDTLVSVQVADLTFQRQGEGDKVWWTVTPVVAGKEVNAKAADALAEQLATLRISSVLGREARSDYGLETPALELAVQQGDGALVTYRLGKRNNDYVLKVSSRPEYFQILKRTGDDLIAAAKRDNLLVTPAEDGGKTDKVEEEEPSATK